jgi:hypothetical protein
MCEIYQCDFKSPDHLWIYLLPNSSERNAEIRHFGMSIVRFKIETLRQNLRDFRSAAETWQSIVPIGNDRTIIQWGKRKVRQNVYRPDDATSGNDGRWFGVNERWQFELKSIMSVKMFTNIYKCCRKGNCASRRYSAVHQQCLIFRLSDRVETILHPEFTVSIPKDVQ